MYTLDEIIILAGLEELKKVIMRLELIDFSFDITADKLLDLVVKERRNLTAILESMIGAIRPE